MKQAAIVRPVSSRKSERIKEGEGEKRRTERRNGTNRDSFVLPGEECDLASPPRCSALLCVCVCVCTCTCYKVGFRTGFNRQSEDIFGWSSQLFEGEDLQSG